MQLANLARAGQFLSTPSARRATAGKQRPAHKTADFYPRPPRGGRPGRRFYVALAQSISIHALREEGDHENGLRTSSWPHISIHALREEGDRHGHGRACHSPAISIHALREEGDLLCELHDLFGATISIHALREEGDAVSLAVGVQSGGFLSTPSARRATSRRAVCYRLDKIFLSTPSARRATSVGERRKDIPQISIHALREEGDHYRYSDEIF